MLIAALAIWLTLVISFVAICRLAANADRRDDVALTERYLSHSIRGPRTLTTSTTSSTGQGRRVRATMTGRSGELLQ
jgi:hypothetical protein